MSEKIILAYSGGLDTSVAIKWIQENYGYEVVTLTADLGNVSDLPAIKQRALDVGAISARVADVRSEFVKDFVFPALRANAMYQGVYPLATALGRPLIARLMVEAAREEGASAVAHGCTGKGNDQVRLDVSVGALAPDLKVIAPAREWGMTRLQEIEYAESHNISVPNTVEKPYSTDDNVWGRSIEAGVLEDPSTEPPDDVYEWTADPSDCPEDPLYLNIRFENGNPVALDGKVMNPLALVESLSEMAGAHGIGRIDHIEDRLVGIKSREIYEAPAAVVLVQAHKALENMVLTRAQGRFGETVSTEYSNLVYDGLWFSHLRDNLQAYIDSSQRYVNGSVRIKMHKGSFIVVGREADTPLYSTELATYDTGDLFDQSSAPGFIDLWGLPVRTQARFQSDEL
ncbi:MAG: argininosuccinate synthase [Dehalococcoidia bacterium]